MSARPTWRRVQALTGAPGQEDLEVGAGVQPGLTPVATEVRGQRRVAETVIGSDNGSLGSREGSHVPRCVTAGDEHHCLGRVMRGGVGVAQPPVMTALLERRAPTSHVVAGLGSSPLQSRPGGSCSTSRVPSPHANTGTERGRRRRRRALRRGSDRQPHQRGRQGLSTLLGGTPQPPSALLVASTCLTQYEATQMYGRAGARPDRGK
jgi:hypothetical protein